MIRYAAAGRTVIVSSHLLAEVEQSCTHLVVMDRGRLIQAGPVSEIIGSGDTLLVGTGAPVEGPVVEKIVRCPAWPRPSQPRAGCWSASTRAAAPNACSWVSHRLEVPVRSVGPHRRLEDAFLTLIGGAA